MGPNDIADDGGSESVQDPIEAILNGTSAGAETAGQGAPGAAGTSEQEAAAAEYKFAGRTWKGGQTEAEKTFNKLYGTLSEQKGIVNSFKAMLKNPEALKALSSHPEFRDIAAKLGIEQAEKEFDEDEDAAARESGEDGEFNPDTLPPPMRAVYDRMMVQEKGMMLRQQQWALEGEMSRRFTPEETRAVYGLVERAPSLSIREAWKLVKYDEDVKRAAEKAGAAKRSERPRPVPGMRIPGSKVTGEKDPLKMNKQEWRDHLVQSEEFQSLMKRE